MSDDTGQPAEEDEELGKKKLVVTVHNEDAGGEPYRIDGEPDTKVDHIIKKLYKDLDTTQKEGDRLYCLANGGDVFAHAEEHLAHYARHECEALEWGYSRPTGGA